MKLFSMSRGMGCAVFIAMTVALGGGRVGAQITNTASGTNAADVAWKEVVRLARPPLPPAEWQTTAPTAEEQAKFFVPLIMKAADKAKEFYTLYPAHPKAAEARKKEFDLLSVAAQQFGDTTQTERLAAIGDERLKDPKLSPQEKEGIEQGRTRSRMAGLTKLARGLPDTADELEKAARAFMKDSPKAEEPYELLSMIAEARGGDKGKALLNEIAASESAPEGAKESAKGLLKRMDALGKPVEIKFTALDGQAVDISKMKDKVVLIDFWATWCGPCVGEIPHVKEAYEKLHSKGFEIVGISFDQSQDKLEKFVAQEQMEWPQYFDGKGWGNKYGQEFGIHGIPTMWLVDKKGNLRDLEARGALEEKVTKLLAE